MIWVLYLNLDLLIPILFKCQGPVCFNIFTMFANFMRLQLTSLHKQTYYVCAQVCMYKRPISMLIHETGLFRVFDPWLKKKNLLYSFMWCFFNCMITCCSQLAAKPAGISHGVIPAEDMKAETQIRKPCKRYRKIMICELRCKGIQSDWSRPMRFYGNQSLFLWFFLSASKGWILRVEKRPQRQLSGAL